MAKKKAENTVTADQIAETLNMLLETDPIAIYRLANLRVACHALKYSKPELTYYVSELDFPVMGVIELLNILLQKNTGLELKLETNQGSTRCRFVIGPKAEACPRRLVYTVPETL